MSDVLIVGLITATFGLIGIIFTAWVSYRIAKLHRQINSRMDELLAYREAVGVQRGIDQEQSDQKDRDDAKT